MPDRRFHRYYPVGLGEHRCGICGGRPLDEAHIAGMNEEIGGDFVCCPLCERNVPMDFTLRKWIKQPGTSDGYGKERSVEHRVCRDCAQDPEATKAAMKRAQEHQSQVDKIAELMGRLDRGEITQDEYEQRLPELL